MALPEGIGAHGRVDTTEESAYSRKLNAGRIRCVCACARGCLVVIKYAQVDM